jgi:hypothetical protein
LPDAEGAWPFLNAIESVGAPVVGTATEPWRCVVLVDSDAQTLDDAMTRVGAIIRDGLGWRASLAWRAGGTLRLQSVALLPHEPATCAGAQPPI